jgi:hypothetical protein
LQAAFLQYAIAGALTGTQHLGFGWGVGYSIVTL